MPAVTRCAPHVRDAVNLRWAMNCVVLALVPSILIGLYNTGLQANLAMARLEIDSAPGWRGFVIDTLRAGYDPSDILAAFLHGALYFVPVLVVALVVGGLWERLFAKLRNRGTAEGLTVIALLFSLSLPPVVPLWQVVLGMSFGIVVGKEIFGGTGKNFLNPAVTGLVFLYASYPQQVVGDTVWRAVDAFTGPTGLLAAEAVGKEGIAWLDTVSFLGLVPGAMGASSVFACLLGAAVLIYKRVASPRILAGVFIGVIGAVVLFNRLGGNSDPFFELPWYWHMTTGSLAFGAVFLATDPVSAASTDPGRWIYGLFVGIMVVVIRVANPAHPDGVLFAILLGNIFAPLIDYIVVRANIRRRARRSG
jgi:Na+-transporting NADH:ubiquinone oxidoreductase subunit B